MDKYSKYKDSGVEWIGEIPEHWNLLKGKFSTNVQSGFPANSDFFTDDTNCMPLIRIRDIDKYETETYYKGYFPEEYVVRNGDVLIGMDGDFNIAVWKGTDALLNQRVCRVESSKLLMKEYTAYLFITPLKLINDVTYSTTVKHLSVYDINTSLLPIPPLSEQQSIAKYLDSKCSKIDHVIAAQQKRVELLKELKQSIITRAVTRGINPNAKMKDSGVEWIGEIPEHWEIMKLKRVLSNFQDGSHESFSRVDSDFPLLSAKNVYENGIVFSEEDSTISEEDYKSIVSNGFPQKGDVTLCCVGTIGRCCIYDLDEPMAFQRSVTFLRVNDFVFNQFLLYLLRSRISDAQYTMYAKTSAQSGIYMNTLVNFNIVVPDVDEQCEIVAFIEWKCSVIDSQLSKINRQIELLQELKQSIITEVVTGKRKVC